jgi:hypothetical protein
MFSERTTGFEPATLTLQILPSVVTGTKANRLRPASMPHNICIKFANRHAHEFIVTMSVCAEVVIEERVD